MNDRTKSILSGFPKTRPPLGPEHQAIALEARIMNREGGNLAARASNYLEGWMHRRVAGRQGGHVLEIGGGTLNHVPYEAEAEVYDVVEPQVELYQRSPNKRRVRGFFTDIREVPEDRRYDRIVSIAVFEHLTDLPACLASAGLLLNPGGHLQVGIPSEGGFLWWLGWRTTTGIAFKRRYGLDYGKRMRHEHINTAPEIIALARHFFNEVSLQRFPTPFHQLSFYAYFDAVSPRLDLCREYLASLTRPDNDRFRI